MSVSPKQRHAASGLAHEGCTGWYTGARATSTRLTVQLLGIVRSNKRESRPCISRSMRRDQHEECIGGESVEEMCVSHFTCTGNTQHSKHARDAWHADLLLVEDD